MIGQTQINEAVEGKVGLKNENSCNEFKQKKDGMIKIVGSKEQVMNESETPAGDTAEFYNTSVLVRSDIIDLLTNSGEGNLYSDLILRS